MNIFFRVSIVFLTLLCVTTPLTNNAQELINEYKATWRGEVLEIKEQELRDVPGTDTQHLYQTLYIEILNGPRIGEQLTIENDYLELKQGDKFYFNYLQYHDGEEVYAVTTIDRRDSLLFFALLFVGAVLMFGGWQGFRSLLALAGSFAAIFYILLPGLLHGINPLFISFVVASAILFIAIFFTHGFNRESTIAYGGTMIAVFFTSILAIVAVEMSSLTGFVTDESVYLNFNTRGALDFTNLLLGAIIIGVLGVLDDIAVTQAAVVTELYNTNPAMSKREVYSRALRVGREHVGALVNTLILAYTGVSLPLLLYFHNSSLSFGSLINAEIFATEIIRTIIGSIGLIMTVPIVTALAAYYLKGYKTKHTQHHSHGHHH